MNGYLNKTFVTIFIFLICYSLFSQNKKADSLLTVISNTKQDSAKFKLYVLLAGEVTNLSGAETYIDSSLLIALKLNNSKYIAMAYSLKGNYFFNRGENKKAVLNHFKALDVATASNNKSYMSKCFNNIANAYDVMGIYDKALSYYFKSLKMKEELQLKDKIYIAKLNIAIVYYNLKEYKKSIAYINESLLDCIKYKDYERESMLYNNLANIYSDMKAYEKAGLYYQKSIAIAAKNEDDYLIALSSSGLANNMYLLKKYDKALKYANIALEIGIKNQFNEHIASAKNELGQTYIALKNYGAAEKNLQEALAIAKNNDIVLEIKNSYENLSNLYSLDNKPEKALVYYRLFSDMKDSLINDNKSQLLANLQENFEIEKKESENKLLQTENELSGKTIKQQRIVTYIIIVGLLITVLLAFFIFRGLKKQKKAYVIISKQKEEVHKQKEIIEEHQKETIDSINYAKRIQYALLANSALLKKNLNKYFVLFKPKDIVSGDFYWATEHNNKFYLAVCDCTGHGVPGAFMSLLNIGFLSEAIKEKHIEKPNEVFNYVRKRLEDSISQDGQQDGMDGILLCIDKSTNQLTYAAANNEPILVSNNELKELAKDKMPVGKGEKTDSFNLYTINATKGDTLYLYTDGYADQFGGEKGKKFKYKQLNERLLSINTKSMEHQKDELNLTIKTWKGNLEQVDDILIVGINL
jgi:serine phosphatase RsbU (regulator of sigma subunit)